MEIDHTYTSEERAAVFGAIHLQQRTGFRPLCPLCKSDGSLCGLGEHFAVDGLAHVVTWRCDRGHVFSCAELLKQLR